MKNREAARRCRDKKQKETYDLKQRNDELQKENCELVRQRNELLEKCQEYESQMEHHKKQGCMVPELSPPCDLYQILDPSDPFSLFSFDKQAFVPLSPSPAVRFQSPGIGEQTSNTDLIEVNTADLGAVATDGYDFLNERAQSQLQSSETMEITGTVDNVIPVTPERYNQEQHRKTEEYYLTGIDETGSQKTVCLSREDYLTIVKKTQPQKEMAAKQQVRKHLVHCASHSPAPQMPMNSDYAKTEITVEKQNQQLGQNQGTVNMLFPVLEDISVSEKLQEHQFQEQTELQCRESNFMLVNPNEILGKQEQVDTQCLLYSSVPLKRESGKLEQKAQKSTSLTGQLGSAEQQKRSAVHMTTLTGQLGSAEQQKRSAVHMTTLERSSSTFVQQDAQLVEPGSVADSTFTVTVTDPKTTQILEQTSVKSHFMPQHSSRHFTGQEITVEGIPLLDQPVSFSPLAAALQQVSDFTHPIKPVMVVETALKDLGSANTLSSVSVQATQNVKQTPPGHTLWDTGACRIRQSHVLCQETGSATPLSPSGIDIQFVLDTVGE